MNKVKQLIPLITFCLYFTKMVLLPVHYYEDAAILLILAATSAFFEYKNSESAIVLLNKKLEDLNKDLENKARDIDALKSSVTSLKLGSSLRPTSNVQR